MINKYVKHLLTILFSILISNQVLGQEQQMIQVFCEKTSVVINNIKKEYGEDLLLWGRGPEGSTGLMTLWINPSASTWTILVSQTDGKTCVIGAGRDLTVNTPQIKGQKNVLPSL